MSTSLIVVIVLLVLAVLYFINLYNKIIRLQTTRENAFSDIDVQMKMRFDLVDNLVNTVKGYAAHEKSTLNEVIEARNKFTSAKNIKDKADADNLLS
jgi:LemA protein